MRRATLAGAVASVLLGAACGADGPPPVPPGGDAVGPGDATVTLRVHHSRFVPEVVRVVEGTTVRFRLVNDDPIDHELIVGGDDVHERHESGTEAEHGVVPGEVSVAAGETATTTFTFDSAGESPVTFACHLPRHLDYGMEGVVEVVPR